MPNHCSNKLTVRGPAKEQERFKQAVAAPPDTVISFNKLVPLPAELNTGDGVKNKPKTVIEAIKQRDKILKYGADNWYDWQINNWGTKWDAYDDELCEGGGKLVYIFTTAWSPPDKWLETMSTQFPKLKFTLYCREDGVGFKGTLTVKDGEILKDTIK